ncbi:MAG: ABC transporter ATP-binding protein, partial [Betaproteobacteria bacterium HGW-Betaproteobacteria-17]
MLNVTQLKTNYGKIEALKGISIDVHEGEIVTLIGANGAGKSTTLKTLSGQLSPTMGTIVFQGDSIAGMPPHKVTQKGIIQVPEGRRIFSRMTILENLEMGAYLRSDKDEIKADLDHVFELFPRLKERLTQKGGTLSGGEQQMLAMGRGLMARPRLLMLDEPSMGLAPVIVETIFEIIG